MKAYVLTSLIFLASCGNKADKMYNQELGNPREVLDSYITSLVHGDVKYTLYYVAGNWEEVGALGKMGDLLANNTKNKARRRFTEFYSWDIQPIDLSKDVATYNVIMKTPKSSYVSDRVAVLTGILDENGKFLNERFMTEEQARDIVRHEKNLPMQTDKFTVRLKKNQYGWIVDGVDDGVSELNSFLNNS